jgi:hypothetical protein
MTKRMFQIVVWCEDNEVERAKETSELREAEEGQCQDHGRTIQKKTICAHQPVPWKRNEY